MTGHNDNMTSCDFTSTWSQLPIHQKVDVLIVGGGPAGTAAAIASAREGTSTLLIEKLGCLGGAGTAGLVPAFCPYTDREKIITKGIALEVLEEMKAGMPIVPKDQYDWVPIDAERLKSIYERRVIEAGAKLLYHTSFIDVLREQDGRIDSVIIHNKSGLQRIHPRYMIDCTGDGDVAFAAGFPFEKGDPQTGDLQPVTHCFVAAGIDGDRFNEFLYADNMRNLLLKDVIAEAKANGDLDIPEVAANVCSQSKTTIGANFSHVFNIDATDGQQLSQAHVEGRRLIQHLIQFMQKYCPGCEEAYLVNSGTMIGIRETRRIIAEYMLSLMDYVNRQSFEDEIARNAYYIDIHLSQKEWENHEKYDNADRIKQYEPGESHGIPYRCLIPKGSQNLLAAGRCIGTDRSVQGSTRVMPVCLATGEAAGTAAAMAAKQSCNIQEVDHLELRTKLKGYGQYLP